MMVIQDVAVSIGSDCTNASLDPRYILYTLGIKKDLSHSSLRNGVGRITLFEEIDYDVI
jgi:cysteine desulfurase